MSRLCMYLPPFSGDYSGVCSSLFDLGGMVCIHDAAGCTGNYTHFDEPRWYGSSSMVYCTRFRKLDAVLGDDEHIVKRILSAAEELHPEFIAIVGSPVPNVIGFDFDGVAKEVSARSHIPCFGFATAGIKGSYKDGIVMAVKKLTDYYQKDVSQEEKNPSLANLLGITPLDIDQDNHDNLRKLLEENGIQTQIPEHNYNNLSQIQQLRKASLNLAWSQAGMELCQYYEKKYGMPYLIGFPIAEDEQKAYIRQIHACIENRTCAFFNEGIHDDANACVISDAVIASAQADLLKHHGISSDCFTVFGKSTGIEHYAVTALSKEEEILQKLNDTKYKYIIADPVLLKYAREDAVKISIPQHAISSRVGKAQNWLWTKEDEWIKKKYLQ